MRRAQIHWSVYSPEEDITLVARSIYIYFNCLKSQKSAELKYTMLGQLTFLILRAKLTLSFT